MPTPRHASNLASKSPKGTPSSTCWRGAKAMDAVAFLDSLDLASLVLLFWYTTLLEIPRYTIGSLIVPLVMLWPWRRQDHIDPNLTLSVILVGHNEEKALRACVQSLAEQTIISKCSRMQIVVVDDGSTDRMSEVAFSLQREG